MTDAQIELLLNSKNLEEVKIGADYLNAREHHKKIDKIYQADKIIEDRRQAEYHRAGFGYILSNKYQMPSTTRNAVEKFLNEPTWLELENNRIKHNINGVTHMLTTGMIYLFIVGMLISIL